MKCLESNAVLSGDFKPRNTIISAGNKSSVGRLNKSICPDAIVRAVATVYVHAFKSKGCVISR
jgi:hypothetical protein